MIRAQASAFGSYNGKPLTGALETPEGETVGSMFASNFYKSAQGMAQLNDAQGSINQVGDAVSKLYQSGKSLSRPNIATALANPAWTAAKLAQGIAGKPLSPEERGSGCRHSQCPGKYSRHEKSSRRWTVQRASESVRGPTSGSQYPECGNGCEAVAVFKSNSHSALARSSFYSGRPDISRGQNEGTFARGKTRTKTKRFTTRS